MKFLRTPTSQNICKQLHLNQLGIRCIYSFLKLLEEEEEYENYLRITPGCFDKLFVFVKDLSYTNMRDASLTKLKLAVKIFQAHSSIDFS